jgi:hypothetical protein
VRPTTGECTRSTYDARDPAVQTRSLCSLCSLCLELTQSGGRFAQSWLTFSEGWVPLPRQLARRGVREWRARRGTARRIRSHGASQSVTGTPGAGWQPTASGARRKLDGGNGRAGRRESCQDFIRAGPRLVAEARNLCDYERLRLGSAPGRSSGIVKPDIGLISPTMPNCHTLQGKRAGRIY